MATTENEINSFIASFSAFAQSRIKNGGADLSIHQLIDEWATQNPPSEDALAIQASIRDMESGDTGRPFAEFADEFRKRNNITGDE